MDASVRSAMAKWPDVPALYGWLRLCSTGRWLLKGEPITHQGLIDFIGRNYQADEHGCWFFQNGPQRVYAHLDYTPWILHLDSGGRLRTHTDEAATPHRSAVVDDQGNLLIDTERGIGLLDPDSLTSASEGLHNADGAALSDAALGALMAGESPGSVRLTLNGETLAVEHMPRAEVPDRFGFISRPRPEDGDDDAT